MEYLDLIIIGILIVVVVICFRNFKTFLYLFGILDIFLRIVRFVSNNIGSNQISSFLHNNFPASIPSIINNYSSGILNTIINWIYVVLIFLWLICLIKYFFKKRK